jgi:microcystin-dependent protein
MNFFIQCVILVMVGENVMAQDRATVAVGHMQLYAGRDADIPAGYVRSCQTLNSIANPEYADLYSVISTSYGGSSASSFSTPCASDRILRGASSKGGTGGTNTEYFNDSRNPNHSHGGWCHNHDIPGTGRDDDNHTGNCNCISNSDAGCKGIFRNFLIQNGPLTQYSSYQGGNGGHNNIPPMIALNLIIAY